MTTLFHYCSVETFQAIIENKSIRLSSLALSNDSAEGKLVREIINRLAKEDRLDEESIAHLQSGLVLLEDLFEGLGFCLSRAGDLLSQWRGYAADGTGFSIGFNQKYFEHLSNKLKSDGEFSFTLEKVSYKTSEQINLISPIYEQIKDMFKDGKLKYPRKLGLLELLNDKTEAELEKERELYKRSNQAFLLRILGLIPILYALKTEAFKEEKEWRLITNLIKNDDDPCQFRALSNRLVPFKTIELLQLKTRPLVEVKIGPKNITPIRVIERFLNQNGFKNVEVSKSTATYR